MGQHRVSQRQACRLEGEPRGTQRYHPIKRADEDLLMQRVISLACRYGRYGYRRIAAMLKLGGFAVGKDRVQRIWRWEGLRVPPKHKLKARL